MCTVTVVHAGEAVRLACNRDELTTRPAALPPRIETFGGRRAILPVDPLSGGTWIAVNDAGLVSALLNVNPLKKREASVSLRSRGSIIPALLHHRALDSAVAQAVTLDARLWAPLRLVIADRWDVAELRSDGTRVLLMGRTTTTEPVLYTSSGLGDHMVETPRRGLFAEVFRRPGEEACRQDQFHRHQWLDRPHLSVCMHRADAQTVSHTIVSLGLDRVTLSYHPDAPDRPAAPVTVTIPLAFGDSV